MAHSLPSSPQHMAHSLLLSSSFLWTPSSPSQLHASSAFKQPFSSPPTHPPISTLLPLAAVSQRHASFPNSSSLPVKEIPGDYGLPLAGVFVDRVNFFVHGKDKFFSSLMEKYDSTVIRVNMPPGPPFFPDSRTIMLLDQKSYPALFDVDKVDKRDVFTGSYMPSLKFTGGFRVLSYLDPSEKKHTTLKNFCFDMLRSNGRKWIPEFHRAFTEVTATWEDELQKNGKADFTTACGYFSLNFLLRSVLGSEASLGSKGPSMIQAWLALQIHPVSSFGLPEIIEVPLLHTFPLPYAVIASQHKKLYKFFRDHSTEVLDKAVKEFGLDREEACHNLMFFICFNTWGGVQLLFPTVMMRVGEGGEELHRELREEVRKAVEEEGGLTMKAIEKMELVRSTVYEVLRIDPPVPFQYGRAKEDMVIESHEAMYKVRKGELLGGYCGMVMKDPKVFEEAEVFKAKRFMGEEGKRLMRSLVWSNGREMEDPTTANKQCAGKEFVNFIARLLLAEFFLVYDSFELAPIVRKGSRLLVSFASLHKKK